MKPHFLAGFSQNILAGLTVSFISISLGAALGIMSGRGALMGMLSAAVIAFFVSLFGGTRVQCSGPTAPMAVVMAGLVAFASTQDLQHISADHFVNIALFLTAILIFAMAFLRLGQFINLIPNVVTSGFMNGIALIILADQGQKIFELILQNPSVKIFHLLFLVGTLVLVFFLPVLTKRFIPQWAGIFSGALVSIVFSTAISVWLNIELPRIDLGQTALSFSGLESLFAEQFAFSQEAWSLSVLLLALPFAAQLAFLLYLDTMLTSVVIDKMTGEKTARDQELAAHGIATAAVSTFGGIPGAQATIRSVLILKEGATWRLAGVAVGGFVFIELFLFQELLGLIPQIIFCGILLKVAFDVLDLKPFVLYFSEIYRQTIRFSPLRELYRNHRNEKKFVTHIEFLLIVGTSLVTLWVNLIFAVLLFTVLFYVINYFFYPKENPLRDLKDSTETIGVLRED